MPEDVTHMLSDAGPIAKALGDSYEARPEQQRMASAVAEAMQSKAHLLVEAGTGVGKSFAYLVPAALRALEHGERVVIATNTISLQEQLLEKDIPLLEQTLRPGGDAGGDEGAREVGVAAPRLKPVLVKGRGNYVSLRRLQLASKRQEMLLPDAAGRRSLHVIEDWAYETEDGSLSTLPALERPGVWDKVQSDSANCMGRKCPTYQQCFYQNARREMEDANLLICNHALFFSDLALRARGVGFLPAYDHVVLDEAHAVEDVAAEHFGLSLSEGRVHHLLGTLWSPRSRKGYLAQLRDADRESVDRAVDLVGRAEQAAEHFFDELIGLQRRLGSSGRIREPGAVQNVLTDAMSDLALRLKSLKESSTSEPDRFELNAYFERAVAIADSAEALVNQSLPGCAYWIETRSSQGRVRATIACSPVEVGPLLAEHLFEKEMSVTLTSATLATRSAGEDEPAERQEAAFAHAMDRLGCEGASTLQLGSPFDYGRQVQLFVDTSMPSPRDAGSSAWHDALTERTLDHLSATEGGAFVLFTSFAALNAVADRLAGPCAELGFPLLAQNRDGPRAEILRRFREHDSAVLLGAASFWQGVDVRGRSLRNVVITRLPFDPPDRPLTDARLERIRERGGDPFREDSLPRAVIRFKQGFGRLIRSQADEGRVVVLDPRIVTTGYGRVFLAALPAGLEPTILRS